MILSILFNVFYNYNLIILFSLGNWSEAVRPTKYSIINLSQQKHK
jgi:hypothetical protein